MTGDGELCRIDPSRIGVVRGVGVFFLVATLASLASGKAYYRQVFDRADHPAMYWSTVISYLVLAAFLIGGSRLCVVG
ncbi:MAG TPA: hypothetical protein VGE27_17875 [Gemmatimonas sp.]|uniref:hypothetical protein n=1 Tax=Gemmatimonas sp. TaxID=1962908 RepID=UPI002ED92E0B